MNDNVIANDFLKALIAKAGFDPKVQNPASSPSIATPPLTVDKYDIAEYIKNPLVRALLLHIGGKMATKYEYEKITQLLHKSSTTNFTTFMENRSLLAKLSALSSENGEVL